MIDTELWRDVLDYLNINHSMSLHSQSISKTVDERPPPVFQKQALGTVEACQKARQYSQSRFDHPIVLIAGAGTGKTATLIARILHWCLGEGWEKAAKELGALNTDEYMLALRVVRRVSAITFTEAAAAEMALRVVEGLNSLVQGHKVVGFSPELLHLEQSELLFRASALLDVVDELTIQTIHAFCQSILTRHAVLADLSPNLSVDADHERTTQLLRDALLEDVLKCFNESEHDFFRYRLYQHCFQCGIQIPQIFNVGLSLIKSGARSEFMVETALNPRHNASHYVQLLKLLTELSSLFLKLPTSRYRAHGTPRIRNAFDTVIALVERIVQASILDYPTVFEGIATHQPEIEALLKFLNAFGQKSFQSLALNFKKRDNCSDLDNQTLFETLQAHSARLRPLLKALSQNDIVSVEIFRLILYPLLQQVEQSKHREGVLNFEDLLYFSAKLVSLSQDNPTNRAARHQVQSGIDLLLVDEFQDTSQIQCELIEALALDPSSSKLPSLFIVGDPKQSIYGWRNADISAYFRFVQRLEAFALQRSADSQCIQHLYQNFRSTPAILSEVEQIIDPVMCATPGLQPPFQSLIGVRKGEIYSQDDGDCVSPIEYWVTWDIDSESDSWPASPKKSMQTDKAALCEAKALVQDILRLRKHYAPEVCTDQDKQVMWSDIAIIFRARGRLPVFIEALREHQVPYVVSGDVNYFKRREVIEATAMLQCILDPNDMLSLVSFLRSSAVGMPDVVFLSLWLCGFPGWMSRIHLRTDDQFQTELDDYFKHGSKLRTLVEQASSNIPNIDAFAAWPVALSRTVQHIRHLRKRIKSATVTQWIDELRSAFSFELTEAAAYQGVYRLANLDRFYLTLHQMLIEAHGNWSEALTQMQRAIRNRKEASEAKPNSITENAVQIMTIHSSKGLDFKHVYLMETHKKSPAGGRFDNIVLPSLGALYAFNQAQTMSIAAAQHHQQLTADHEMIRLLYVALTRAKNRLVISGVFPDKIPTPKQNYNAFSQIIGMRLGQLTDGVSLNDHLSSAFWPDCSQQLFGQIALCLPSLTKSVHINSTKAFDQSLPQTQEIKAYTLMQKQQREMTAVQSTRPLNQCYSSISSVYGQSQIGPSVQQRDRRNALLILEGVIPSMLRCELSQVDSQRIRQMGLLLNHRSVGVAQVEVQSIWNRLHSNLKGDVLLRAFGFTEPHDGDIQVPLTPDEWEGVYLAVPPVHKVYYTVHRLEKRKDGWVMIEYVLDDAFQSASNAEKMTVTDWFRSEVRLIEVAARSLKVRFQLDILKMEVWDLFNLRRIQLGEV
ncbi:MAG: UvrD-helicase domain-containing protein [Myxococcota bacterium]|nr:UvrD-helicase domain-containing protein [Myxococcota bacterium]